MKVKFLFELNRWCDVSANTARPLTLPEINDVNGFFQRYNISGNERFNRSWEIGMPSDTVPPMNTFDIPGHPEVVPKMKAMGTHEMFDCKSTIMVELHLYEIIALIEWHGKRKLECAEEEQYTDANDHKNRAAWLETYRKANK